MEEYGNHWFYDNYLVIAVGATLVVFLASAVYGFEQRTLEQTLVWMGIGGGVLSLLSSGFRLAGHEMKRPSGEGLVPDGRVRRTMILQSPRPASWADFDEREREIEEQVRRLRASLSERKSILDLIGKFLGFQAALWVLAVSVLHAVHLAVAGPA